MDQQIATAEYRRTVHAAIRETGDVLADADAADRAVCTAAAVVAAAQRQMTIERRRYEAGASALSDFLRAEQLLSMAEDQKIQASQSRVGGYVALYRVLGGTWAVHTQTVNDHSAITRGDGCED
ncbi:Antibiotic efflux pump outer membrane protein ArpC precursor [compost metagenome]